MHFLSEILDRSNILSLTKSENRRKEQGGLIEPSESENTFKQEQELYELVLNAKIGFFLCLYLVVI